MNIKLVKKHLFLFLLIPMMSFGNHTSKKHEKTKLIKKKFEVSATSTVDISNKYGNVNFTTWSKNTVEIEVEITVKGNDLEDVESKLEDIDVDFYHSNYLVEAKTVIKSRRRRWSFWGNHNNVNYQINYLVKMPITNNVVVNNDYGSIYLDKLEGKSTINCDYGKIIIGDLLNNTNEINLEYCSRSTISYVKKAEIRVDYSKLSVEKSEVIKLNSDYSNVQFTEVKDLDYNLDYGSIRVEDAWSVNGDSDYTTLRFGSIKKELLIDAAYGSLRIDHLEKGFSLVDVDAEYLGVKIGVAPNNNFRFEVKLQYASFRYDEDRIELFKSIEKNSEKYYEGVYGKGTANSKIRIKSQYGSVSIREK